MDAPWYGIAYVVLVVLMGVGFYQIFKDILK